MNEIKSFKINKYLELRLEDGNSIIYVGSKRFQQCKYLLLEIIPNEIKSFDDIESIDEISKRLDKSLELNKEEIKIPPEIEFWGHSSNLQVWAENDYDTKLLHSSLGFPLLKKIADAGDPIAKKVFKKEIIKRLSNGYPPVVGYLINEGYINYLDESELYESIIDYNERNFLEEISSLTNKKYVVVDSFKTLLNMDQIDISHYSLQNGKITEFEIFWYYTDDGIFPKSIVNLKNIKTLFLYLDEKAETIPQEIFKLKSLTELRISGKNIIHIPESIGDLYNLKKLIINQGNFKYLPESIGLLKSIKLLKINSTSLEFLPKSIIKLNSLIKISVNNTSINKFLFNNQK